MSRKKPAAAADGTPAPDIPTPTVTHWEQIIANLSANIDAIEAQFPDFALPHPNTVNFVRRHQNIPLKAVATCTTGVAQIPALQATGKFDVQKNKDNLQFLDATDAFVDQVVRFATGLVYTRGTKRAESTADMLQMYAIAKGMARDSNSPEIAAFVGLLQRDIGRVRPKTRSKPSTPPPAGGQAGKGLPS
jgi:hypothetical protein